MDRWAVSFSIAILLIFGAMYLIATGPERSPELHQRSSLAVETDEKIIRACSILCCRASRSDDGKSCGDATKYTSNKHPKDTPVICHCQVRTGKNEELLNMEWTVDLLGVR